MRTVFTLMAGICAACLCQIGIAAAGPEPGPGSGLTLEEAIRTGLAANPDLSAARSRLDSTAAGLSEAQAGRWPRLFAEAGARRTNNQVTVFSDKLTAGEFTADDFELASLNEPDPISHLMAAVSVEMPLFTSGRIDSSILASEGMVEASRAGIQAAEADLTHRIIVSYHGVSLAQAGVSVAEAALSDAREHERVAQARFETGASLRSDLLRAQVLRLSREQALESARSDVLVAGARLRRLLSLEPRAPLDISTSLAEPSEPLGDLEGWITRGLSDRPELERERLMAGVARAGSRSARAERGPEVAGLARYERNAGGFDAGEGSYLVGVSLRWSPFDKGRPARIQQAAAQEAAAAAGVASMEDAVRFEVEQAYHAASLALRNLEVSREAVAAAVAARRITADRYEAGLQPLTDLLDIDTQLVRARLGEVAALYDSVAQRAGLARAAGQLEVPR